MPECKKCHITFPNRVVIDGRERVIHRRKYCLVCSPFGQHNTKRIHLPRKRRAYDNHYKYVKKRRDERKSQLIEMKGGKCAKCGYAKCYAALDFHHVNPKEKKFELSRAVLSRKKWQDILLEAEKTILLCKVCHVEIEQGLD